MEANRCILEGRSTLLNHIKHQDCILKQHVENNNNHNMTKDKVINVTCRCSPTFHSICIVKHQPNILKITSKMHLPNQTTPNLSDPLDILNKQTFEEPVVLNKIDWLLDLSSIILSKLQLGAYGDLKKWTWIHMFGDDMFFNRLMKSFMDVKQGGVVASQHAPTLSSPTHFC